MAWTTPRTWVDDELVTADLLNTHVRDNFSFLYDTKVPTAAVMPYAGLIDGSHPIPTGWLLCNGQAVSRTTYANLYAALSTTYGVGDGVTTFNVPDLRGRLPLPLDNMGGSDAGRVSGSAADTLSGVGGLETHTLTVNELPAHRHVLNRPSGGVGAHGLGPDAKFNNTGGGTFAADGGGQEVMNTTGGGAAHNNMPPYMALHYIIKT